MPALASSPDTSNYSVGKGALWFKRDGASDFVHMGNCSSFTFQAVLESLDHYSSMGGVKEKDKSVTLTRSATVEADLEEFTAANLSLALLGVPEDVASPVGSQKIDLLTEDKIGGALKFISASDIGPRWNFYINRVLFSPRDALNLISDEWNAIPLTGDVVKSGGDFGYAEYIAT